MTAEMVGAVESDVVFDPMEWQEDAACLGTDPDLFFPEKGDNADAAKAICRVCPVMFECAEHGLHERFGVWGGMTEADRRRRRRASVLNPATKVCPRCVSTFTYTGTRAPQFCPPCRSDARAAKRMQSRAANADRERERQREAYRLKKEAATK